MESCRPSDVGTARTRVDRPYLRRPHRKVSGHDPKHMPFFRAPLSPRGATREFVVPSAVTPGEGAGSGARKQTALESPRCFRVFLFAGAIIAALSLVQRVRFLARLALLTACTVVSVAPTLNTPPPDRNTFRLPSASLTPLFNRPHPKQHFLCAAQSGLQARL